MALKLNPADLVNLRRTCQGILNERTEPLAIDATSALETLISGIDGVLAITAQGGIPTVPPAKQPGPPSLESRVAVLEGRAGISP